ncbi:MAG: hypothetical protein GC154_02415 [bacterium]|nr:hypothetical protein [bacterium]
MAVSLFAFKMEDFQQAWENVEKTWIARADCEDQMPDITVLTDREKDLTVHVVAGNITAFQIEEEIKRFYQNTPTQNLLWDLRNADLSEIKSDEVKKILSLSLSLSPTRAPDGKTALVASSDMEFGVGRIVENYTEIYKHPIRIRLFRSFAEAMRWLCQ